MGFFRKKEKVHSLAEAMDIIRRNPEKDLIPVGNNRYIVVDAAQMQLQINAEKEARKKQKTVEIKEVRLSPNIDTNDLNTKVNNAKKFISKGNKVKVTLRFRGREMAHVQQSRHILDDFAKMLEDMAVVEKAPKLEGRNMSMVLTEKR